MRRLIATCLAGGFLGAFAVGCGTSECDKYSDCCSALSTQPTFSAIACTVSDDRKDDECRADRATAAASALLAAQAGTSLPTECTED